MAAPRRMARAVRRGRRRSAVGLLGALGLAALPAGSGWADVPLAPPGPCAFELETEVRPGLTDSADGSDGAGGVGAGAGVRLRFEAGGGIATLDGPGAAGRPPPPEPMTLPPPSACDAGSACVGVVAPPPAPAAPPPPPPPAPPVVEVPPPSGGCGGPGFPCP